MFRPKSHHDILCLLNSSAWSFLNSKQSLGRVPFMDLWGSADMAVGYFLDFCSLVKVERGSWYVYVWQPYKSSLISSGSIDAVFAVSWALLMHIWTDPHNLDTSLRLTELEWGVSLASIAFLVLKGLPYFGHRMGLGCVFCTSLIPDERRIKGIYLFQMYG